MSDDRRDPDDPSAAASIPPDRDLYTIPLRSSWFRWDEIHDTEMRALPEFFGPPSLSRSPRVYKDYRDFIINKYREDPTRRLTFTEIRKSLIGDVGFLRKVFDFLDSWGLINFSVSDEGVEKGEKGFPVVSVDEGPPGGLKVVPFPSSTKGIEAPSQAVVGISGRNVGGGIRMPPLSSYADVFGNAPRLNCVVCGYCGERCSAGFYESKKGGLAACSKCFKDDKYKGTIAEEDFEFNDGVEGSEKAQNNDWTDAETLHLLESVIAKRNDWALVSDQARRNKVDCIAKLIQLPFGEHMLSLIGSKHNYKDLVRSESDLQHLVKQDNSDIKHCQHCTNGDREDTMEDKCSEPLPKRRCIALPEASISLMDQVAVLSTVAGPHVAISAAEAAISALCTENAYAKKVFNVDDSAPNKSSLMLPDFLPKREPNGEDNLSQVQPKVSDFADASNPTPEKDFVHLTFQMRAAIATAFGSAAARARTLADQEDREIELLMSIILEMQIKKLESKVEHFEELELIMEREYIHMQQLKDTMLAEWVHILQTANEAGLLKWRDQGFSKSLQTEPV